MIPFVFVLLESLPLTPSGKINRRALPAPDSTQSELQSTSAVPRDEWEIRLTGIWRKLLKVERVGIHDDFFDLGGHSMLVVRLAAEIEKGYGQSLPLATLFHAPTIEQQAAALRHEEEVLSRSLVALQPQGNRPPLFFVEGAAIYRDLVRYLGPDQPVYGLIQSQEHEGKWVDYRDIADNAARYIKEIRTIQPQGPYYLAGLCLGGTTAFVMAQRLHAQGEKVALLALFDTVGPRLISMPLLPRLATHLSVLTRQKPDQQFAYIWERVQSRLKRTAQTLRRENRLKTPRPKYLLTSLPSSKLHTTWTNRQTAKSLRPSSLSSLYPGRIILFIAKDNSLGFYTADPQLGWDGVAAGGLEVHIVPGHHASIIKEPHVRVLAEQMKACLHNAQTPQAQTPRAQSQQAQQVEQLQAVDTGK